MTAPRDVDERLDWFLSHDPSGSGMCAQHSWHALGGDYGNPPAWGASDANDVYAKVVSSGRCWSGTPKRGALVLWKYGEHGHAALCYDDAGTKIATTDASDGLTGVEPISYPSKWGATSSARIWTDTYNGVTFPIGDDMALTDDDIERIAKAVWQYSKAIHTSLNIDGTTDDEPSYRSAQDALYDTRYRAIRGPA